MRHKFIMIVVFLGILLLFTVGSICLPEKGFSESENRYLAVKPEFAIEKLLDGSFGTSYETYLSDQFPLRDPFVAAKTSAERLMLKADVNGVYFGNDDYYIEKLDFEELFTEQLLKNINYLAMAADQFSERLGAEHVKLMMVPSASQILTEKLPPFASPADQGRVIELLREKLTYPSMLLPVEQEFKKHEQEPIYYRTDHHWTTRGAYYGYRLYCEAVGIEPWGEEEFTRETVSTNFLGTIEAKVRVPMKTDEIEIFKPRKLQKYKVYYDGLPKEYDSLYNLKALEGKDQYSVFLDGNHGLTKIVNETLKSDNGLMAKDRLLILKDSYAHSFAPFAANHYGEVYMVDLRYFNMKLSDFMDANGITDVLVLYQIPGFSREPSIFKMPLSLDGTTIS